MLRFFLILMLLLFGTNIVYQVDCLPFDIQTLTPVNDQNIPIVAAVSGYSFRVLSSCELEKSLKSLRRSAQPSKVDFDESAVRLLIKLNGAIILKMDANGVFDHKGRNLQVSQAAAVEFFKRLRSLKRM